MGGLTNPVHIAFIAMIALLFLGPKKLPEVARSIGSGMREFRDTLSGSSDHEPEAPEPAGHLTTATSAVADPAGPPPAAPAPAAPAPDAPAPHVTSPGA